MIPVATWPASAAPASDWVDYDTHARTRPRDDLWGQVRRTVRGQPVAASQIDMIVAVIRRQLALETGDTVLDLACGNGALTARLQPHVAASLGVDISGYLVDVACERFASGVHDFHHQDAADFVRSERRPARFTKALCYGSLSYFDDAAVRRMLHGLHARFPSLDRIFLGNLPDPSRAELFYHGAIPDLRQPRSDIGAWRSPAHLANLAGPGWDVRTSVMEPRFFASHYRYDALLTRSP